MSKSVQKHEIMTVAQVAEYLQLAEKTILKMAQQGKIPAAKIASQWRFLRPLVRDWLASEMQMIPVTERVHGQPENTLLPLKDIIFPDLIAMEIIPDAKVGVFKQMIEPLKRSGAIRTSRELLDGLMEREELMTTATGSGVALPHPRHPISGLFKKPAIVVGLCDEGTEFDAVDEQPVNILLLICATREDEHLRLMATAGWLMRQENVVKKLLRAKSNQDVVDYLLSLGDNK